MSGQEAPRTSPSTSVSSVAAYAVAAALVAAILGLLVALQGTAEAAAAGVAAVLPLGYAFAAGMVASVNPCGFILLPSYISYYLGTETAEYYARPALERAAGAVGLGVAVTLGFVVVFASAGAAIAAGGQWLMGFFPYAAIGVGLILTGLGAWLLVSHRTLGIAAATRVAVSPGRSAAHAFLFGIGYAVGSLGCTLPVFLVVVGSSLMSRNFATALTQFVGYSLGMGAVLVAVTLGAALFRGAVGRALRGVVPHVHRISALFLIAAGLYLVYYWAFYSGFVF